MLLWLLLYPMGIAIAVLVVRRARIADLSVVKFGALLLLSCLLSPVPLFAVSYPMMRAACFVDKPIRSVPSPGHHRVAVLRETHCALGSVDLAVSVGPPGAMNWFSSSRVAAIGGAPADVSIRWATSHTLLIGIRRPEDGLAYPPIRGLGVQFISPNGAPVRPATAPGPGAPTLVAGFIRELPLFLGFLLLGLVGMGLLPRVSPSKRARSAAWLGAAAVGSLSTALGHGWLAHLLALHLSQSVQHAVFCGLAIALVAIASWRLGGIRRSTPKTQ